MLQDDRNLSLLLFCRATKKCRRHWSCGVRSRRTPQIRGDSMRSLNFECIPHFLQMNKLQPKSREHDREATSFSRPAPPKNPLGAHNIRLFENDVVPEFSVHHPFSSNFQVTSLYSRIHCVTDRHSRARRRIPPTPRCHRDARGRDASRPDTTWPSADNFCASPICSPVASTSVQR
jgi:hypothetical protein